MPLATIRNLFRPALMPTNGEATASPLPQSARRGNLVHMAVGQRCKVADVKAPPEVPQWARWLDEIGFITGEPAVVTARSPWGDGALVVRIGSSNFALRKEEASCVTVTPL